MPGHASESKPVSCDAAGTQVRFANPLCGNGTQVRCWSPVQFPPIEEPQANPISLGYNQNVSSPLLAFTNLPIAMQLTPHQWEELAAIFRRLAWNTDWKNVLLTRIAREGNRTKDDDPFAQLVGIASRGRFFEELRDVLIVPREGALIRKFVQEIHLASLNASDKGTLQTWLDADERDQTDASGRMSHSTPPANLLPTQEPVMAQPDPAPSGIRSKTTTPSSELQSLASAGLNQGLTASTVHVHTLTINNAPATSPPQVGTQSERGASADPRRSTNAPPGSTHATSARPTTAQPSGDRAPDCIEETVEQLLQDAPGLLKSIVDSKVLDLVSEQSPSPAAVAKCLLNPPNNDLPIITLEHIVSVWYQQRSMFRFEARDANEFHAIKDLLVIRSLPTDDRNKIVAAIQRAKNTLQRSTGNGAVPCKVSKSYEAEQRFVQRLVYQIWCEAHEDTKLRAENLKILFHPQTGSENKRQRLLRRVRFIDEPSVANDTQYFNGHTIKDLAQHIVRECERKQYEIEDPLKHLLEVTIPRNDRDSGLLVMYVADRRTMNETLQLLDQHLPQIVCLELQPVVGNQYVKVSTYVDYIYDDLPPEYRDKATDVF